MCAHAWSHDSRAAVTLHLQVLTAVTALVESKLNPNYVLHFHLSIQNVKNTCCKAASNNASNNTCDASWITTSSYISTRLLHAMFLSSVLGAAFSRIPPLTIVNVELFEKWHPKLYRYEKMFHFLRSASGPDHCRIFQELLQNET
jgi:hypothetical protein